MRTLAAALILSTSPALAEDHEDGALAMAEACAGTAGYILAMNELLAAEIAAQTAAEYAGELADEYGQSRAMLRILMGPAVEALAAEGRGPFGMLTRQLACASVSDCDFEALALEATGAVEALLDACRADYREAR